MIKNLVKILLFIFCVNFTIAQDLEQCVGDQSYEVSQNAPYQVGDVIEFTYTLESFEQIYDNWIIAFQINVGDGWTNLTPISAPDNPNPNNNYGQGYWEWDDQNTFPSYDFGPGFRFINEGAVYETDFGYYQENGNWYFGWHQDLVAGNPYWGSSSEGPFTFTFQATVGPTCTSDELNMSVQAIGDCLTGDWVSPNCCEDPIFEVFDGSVSIVENQNDTVYLSSCESIEWNGQNYNQSGIYTYSGISVDGCDSVVTLDLTILNSDTGIDQQSHCDSYIWIDGNEYTSSNNTATVTLTNEVGCDSVVTLDLTIFNSNTVIDQQTHCDEYTWIDGVTYYENNNTATYTLTNQNGCDSLVTLDLTLYQTPLNDTIFIETCTSINLYNQLLTNNITGIWDGPSILGLANNYLSPFNPYFNPFGTYSYIYIDEDNGCDNIFPINVSEVSTIADTLFLETCNDINLYSQLSIDDATGIWDGPSNLSGGFLGSFSYDLNLFDTYFYSIEDNGCLEPNIFPVSISQIISTLDTFLIETCEQVNFWSTLITNNVTNNTGSWTGPSELGGFLSFLGTFNPNNHEYGIYDYTIVDQDGCSDIFSVIVSESNVNAGPDTTIYLCVDDNSINLFNYLDNNIDLNGSWSPSSSIESVLPTFNPLVDNPGTYIYTIGENNCSDSVNIDINIIDINLSPIINLN